MSRVMFAAAALALSASVAVAQTATPGIDARQAKQAQRIGAGVAKGDLTPGETARLARGQARIQRMETRAKADGTVTAAERARIHRAQTIESRKIYRARHNDKVAR